MTGRLCSVCRSEDRDEINRHLANRQPVRRIEAWTREQGRPISRTSIARHLTHALDEKSQLVQGVSGQKIKRVTTDEYLHAVVDTAHARVEANKDEVTVDHGLRAAQVLESRKNAGHEQIRMLALVLMGNAPDTIEGEYRELPMKGTN